MQLRLIRSTALVVAGIDLGKHCIVADGAGAHGMQVLVLPPKWRAVASFR
jgi:hypothetical protein